MFVIPCSLFGVFLVRTGTVSRDASLLEFRFNCACSEFCAVSDTPNKIGRSLLFRQICVENCLFSLTLMHKACMLQEHPLCRR